MTIIGATMRALLAVLVLSTVMIAPAHAAVVVGAQPACPGAGMLVPTQANGVVYDFRKTFVDTLHPDVTSHTLVPLSPYPYPIIGTESIRTTDNTVMTTPVNVFNPGYSDFDFCCKYSVDVVEDGNNVCQVGNSHLVSSLGFIKINAYYVEYNTDKFRAKASTKQDGLGMRGRGYHTIGMTRRGQTFCAWFDGIKEECKTYQGTFAVNLNQRLAVAGKIDPYPVHTSDMLYGYVARVVLVKR